MANGNCWNARLAGMATGRTIAFVVFAWRGPKGEYLVVAVNYAPHQSQCHVRLPFADLAGTRWQLQDQLSPACHEWNGDDLQGRGLFLDLAPWQACAFLLCRAHVVIGSRMITEDKMNATPTESIKAPNPPRGIAISGLVFSALYISSLVPLRRAVPADSAEVGDWLADLDLRNWVHIALDLLPFAGIAFLWFMGVLRNRIGLLEDRFFATVFLGSGLLFVAMLFTAAAVSRGLLDTFSSRHSASGGK